MKRKESKRVNKVQPNIWQKTKNALIQKDNDEFQFRRGKTLWNHASHSDKKCTKKQDKVTEARNAWRGNKTITKVVGNIWRRRGSQRMRSEVAGMVLKTGIVKEPKKGLVIDFDRDLIGGRTGDTINNLINNFKIIKILKNIF